MPCGHGSKERSLSRRDFCKAAVAIGGSNSLAACLEREIATTSPAEQEFPTGPSDLSTLPDRQHAWTKYLVTDRFGNTSLPQHQLLLFLNYTGETPPTKDDRDQVEKGLQTLERAFQRGTGGDSDSVEHEGLLFTLGYSPTYFDRFDDPLPESVDLSTAEEVISEVDGSDPTSESTPTADRYDAVLHLASGYSSILLMAEEALFGDVDRINGVGVTGSFSGVFERAERRSGFIGKGLPAEKYDHDSIPESSPLSMGFKSGFGDNLPAEDRVTIPDGPFADGTTQQVSKMTHDLEKWYSTNDHEDRVSLMFSPHHTTEEVGEIGERLASHSGITRKDVEKIEEDAQGKEMLGHGQKLAKARDEDFRPRVLRRDFDSSTEPGLHFDGWQRGISDFVETRKAMNSSGGTDGVAPEHHGILDYIEVTNRATYLMPPRPLRALPSPRP